MEKTPAANGLEKVVEEKVEDGAKVALWGIFGPHPSLALVRFWQGIVELCIAIVVIVSGTVANSAATVSHTNTRVLTETSGYGVKINCETKQCSTIPGKTFFNITHPPIVVFTHTC